MKPEKDSATNESCVFEFRRLGTFSRSIPSSSFRDTSKSLAVAAPKTQIFGSNRNFKDPTRGGISVPTFEDLARTSPGGWKNGILAFHFVMGW
jgi:hypothetical protein